MKKILSVLLVFMWVSPVLAQESFWTFDDKQEPVLIPSECEGHFDEVRGGVFNPSIEDLYEYGRTFLKSADLKVKQQGAYCILSAALQGHSKSQFLLAQMYEQGKILPQDDLSAYKWAFMAALRGEKEAERYTLTLEQFLTTDELERTNAAIQETRMKVQENIQRQMDEENKKIVQERETLTRLAKEIQKYGNDLAVSNDAQTSEQSLQPGELPPRSEMPTEAEVRAVMPDLLGVFHESDRFK